MREDGEGGGPPGSRTTRFRFWTMSEAQLVIARAEMWDLRRVRRLSGPECRWILDLRGVTRGSHLFKKNKNKKMVRVEIPRAVRAVLIIRYSNISLFLSASLRMRRVGGEETTSGVFRGLFTELGG